MTDYPTREAIGTTRRTLTALYDKMDKRTVVAFTAASVLQSAVRICGALDAFPGLHYPDAEPKPEPERTPAQVLDSAFNARAYEANRDLAAAAERDAVVAFLRRQVALMNDDDRSDAADALIVVAACIDAGDHRR